MPHAWDTPSTGQPRQSRRRPEKRARPQRKRNVDGGVPPVGITGMVTDLPECFQEIRERRAETQEYAERIRSLARIILRKEVIQPQVPLRLPCYDFTPVAEPTVVGCLPCGLAHHLRVNPTPMV